jgi:hypothetical protein
MRVHTSPPSIDKKPVCMPRAPTKMTFSQGVGEKEVMEILEAQNLWKFFERISAPKFAVAEGRTILVHRGCTIPDIPDVYRRTQPGTSLACTVH